MKTVLTLALLTPLFAFAGSPKLDKKLDTTGPGAMVDVIIQYAVPVEARHFNKVVVGGGRLKSKFESALNGGVFSIPAGLAKKLAEDPDVKYISLDRRVGGSLDYANPAVNANIAYAYNWTGKTIGIAVIDSGVSNGSNTHYDLKSPGLFSTSRVVYSENFVPGESTTNDPYGHGEHVAGIIAGNATRSLAKGSLRFFRGIAPEANIINLRALDSQGAGTDSTVIAAIDRAIVLRYKYNIRVINLSLGRAIQETWRLDPLCQAVERAWKAGIVVVVAAGNGGRNDPGGTQGYGTILSPANDPYVITVGAMNDGKTADRSDDVLASYSSKGPTAIDRIVKPDIVAPGNQIVSLMPAAGGGLSQQSPSPVTPASYYLSAARTTDPTYYMRLSGTSMATPVVSGAAALLLQKNPTLTNEAVKAILMRTATKTFPTYTTAIDAKTGAVYTQHYDIFSVGAGYLDVWAALNYASFVPFGKTAASPQAVLSSAGKVVVPLGGTLDGTNVIWGGDNAWTASTVWGAFFISGTNVIWGGDDLCWSNTTLAANSAIWGNNVIWGGDDSLDSLISLNGDW